VSDGYLYCPKCGCEYHAWASTCVDCGVALVAQPPAVSEVVEKPRAADDSNADHSLSVVDVGDLSADERDRLTFVLRGSDLPHRLNERSLEFPTARATEAHELLGWVTEVRVAPPIVAPEPSGRADWRVVASRSRRLAGYFVDGIPWIVLASMLWELDVPRWPFIALHALYIVGFTATTGAPLGKLVMGTRVVDVDAGVPPSVFRSALRWLTLAWAAFLPGRVGATAAFVWQIAVFSPILWDERRQGLHDRVARTIVIRRR
jgi:uncharacterized RDD family membrane protein YckC